MSDILRQTILANRSGKRAALPSVCSAHPVVLEAAMGLAAALKRPLIVEATSNQVNQFGGYTGMRPADFVAFVTKIAAEAGFGTTNLVFGGDHLGPQVWRAARAAQLAKICEQSAVDPRKLSYMVGTEVPPPGGAHGDGETVTPTDPTAAEATLQAHSTDYQQPSAYPALAGMGFAILKVGSALTHAYRQALYALDALRATFIPNSPHLPEVMEALMLANPAHWQSHYHGDGATQKKLRHTGLADRIRYYWAHPEALEAVGNLMTSIDALAPTPAQMAPYFEASTLRRAEKLRAAGQAVATAFVLAHIQHALAPYFFEEGDSD